VKYFKVDRRDGKFAATAHGLTRDGSLPAAALRILVFFSFVLT
jgi:hypothetical protein